MTISVPPSVPTLPTPPSSTDPASFDSRGDAFLEMLPGFGAAVNDVGQSAYANAQHASEQATAASASAAAAATSATGASGSATSAATSAGTASAAATTATAKAAEALAGATTATAKATAASASADDAESAAADALRWAQQSAAVASGNLMDDSQVSPVTTWSSQKIIDVMTNADPLPSGGTATHYLRGDKTWQTLNKAAVGLSNVDNTKDADKPVSTAQQGALDAKAPATTTLADNDGANALPAITATSIVTTLQVVRNCLKWLVAKFAAGGEVDKLRDLRLGSTNAVATTDRSLRVNMTADFTLPTNAVQPMGDGATILLTNLTGATRTLTGPAANSLRLNGDTSTRTTCTLVAYSAATLLNVGTDSWFVMGARP